MMLGCDAALSPPLIHFQIRSSLEIRQEKTDLCLRVTSLGVC